MKLRFRSFTGLSGRSVLVYTVAIILALWVAQFVGGKVASVIGVSRPIGTVIVLYIVGVASGVTAVALKHRHRH
jgi:hypothetical protein